MKTYIIKQIIKEELKKIIEGETAAPAKPATKPDEKTKHPVIPKHAPKTKPKANAPAPAKPATKPDEKTKHPVIPKQAPKTRPKAEKEELDESDVDGMMNAIIKRYKDSKK